MGKNSDLFRIDLKNFEKFNVAKARLVLSLRYLKDEKIRKAGIAIKTGWKW